jgi:hypothetical protein
MLWASPACYGRYLKKSPERISHSRKGTQLLTALMWAPDKAVGRDGKEREGTLIRTEADDTTQFFGRSNRISNQPSAPTFWLICRCLNGRLPILTLDRFSLPDSVLQDKTLPVFGCEEEAQAFLTLGGTGVVAGVGDGDWMMRESGAEELLWLLCGPEGVVVKKVALDPSPEMVIEGMVGLVSMFRERFIEHLIAKYRHLRVCEPVGNPSCAH